MQRSCVFDCVQSIHLSTCVVNIFYGKYPTFYLSNFFSSDSAHVYAIHNRQNVINQGRVPGFIAFTSQEIFLSASRHHAASMRWRNVTIRVRVQLASGLKADTEIPFMMPYCWPQPLMAGGYVIMCSVYLSTVILLPGLGKSGLDNSTSTYSSICTSEWLSAACCTAWLRSTCYIQCFPSPYLLISPFSS